MHGWRFRQLNKTFSLMSAYANKSYFSTGAVKPKTGILMMNLGGPKKSEDAGTFMYNMFTDKQVVPVLKNVPRPIVRWICNRRAGKSVKQKYDEIGGGTPLYYWTNQQGSKMCELLDKISPESAPHKHYIAFRYSLPGVKEAVEEAIEDGVEHMIGFSQYPQYSCSTTNSSIQEFHRSIVAARKPETTKVSLIDRWYTHKGYHRVLARLLAEDIKSKFDEKTRPSALILFTAHSLPLSFVERGDTYPYEIYITAQAVMDILREEHNIMNPFRVVWQSRIGARWLRPALTETIEKLPEKKWDNVIVSPLGFTSDHIETLHELDIELKEDAEKAGVKNLQRARSLNDEPDFVEALADIVQSHIHENKYNTSQLLLRCPSCVNPDCNRLSTFYQPNPELDVKLDA